MAGQKIGRVLLTNDDGLDAPGLAILEQIALEIADEVWISAPVHDASGTAGSLSLHNPLRAYRAADRRYGISGTPADCVLMALNHLMADCRPDLVLSGVNAGANVAGDVNYSGTSNAALTALQFGCPAIALSQAYHDRQNIPWAVARQWGPKVIRQLLAMPDWPVSYMPNINFPDTTPDDVTGISATRQGQGFMDVIIDHRIDSRDKDYYWLALRRRKHDQADDTDIAALRRNEISVSPIGFDRTVTTAMAGLGKAVG